MIKHYDKESDARFTKSQQMWIKVKNKGPVKHIHQLFNGYANNLCFMLAEKKKPQSHGSQKSNNIFKDQRSVGFPTWRSLTQPMNKYNSNINVHEIM